MNKNDSLSSQKKHYIILDVIVNVGGGQVFIRNKVDYLRRHGWTVDVYNGRNGKIEIQDLNEYAENFYLELDELPFYISKGEQEQLIDKMIGERPFDIVVVETYRFNYAVWGELIAARAGGKHIFVCLDELFLQYRKWEYEFLDFKHNRRELAGIEEASLGKMFAGYKEVSKEESYHLYCVDDNVVSSATDTIQLPERKSDITLGCVSRLDKVYVLPMMEAVVQFASRYQDKEISFVLVGDAPEDKETMVKIKKLVQASPNLNLYALGYLFPIPQAVIDYVDCFICTSGAALATAQAGGLTIAVDAERGRALGIVGEDVGVDTSIFLKEPEDGSDLCDYLEYTIFHRDKEELQEKVKKYFQKSAVDYMHEFDNHMRFIEDSNQTKEYYQFDSIEKEERTNFQLMRYERIIKIYDRWMKMRLRGIKISSILKERGYRSIIIYGMGHMGKNLYDELKNSDIQLVELVDRQAHKIRNDVPIHSGISELSGVDAVIVTMIGISEMTPLHLRGTYSKDCRICSLEELILGQDIKE